MELKIKQMCSHTQEWISIILIIFLVNMVEKLCCGDADIVIKSILTLKDNLPQPQCIKVLGVLLVGTDKEIADYIG